MNKQLTILGTALLLGAATSAFAASSTDLTVTGIITPTACTPSLANGGVVDYGKISAKDLKETSSTQLEPQTLQLTVSCDAATQFAIQPVDNRRDSQGTLLTQFGLGMINGSEKLGFYKSALSNLNADVASRLLISLDRGNSWGSTTVPESLAEGSWYSFGDPAGTTPHAISNATMDLTVTPTINRADGLTLTDEVQLDGSATLQIVYL